MSDKKIGFEEALGELEKIISSLESGSCTLEESIALFEKGIKYTDDCRNALKAAQNKIVTLTQAEEESEID